ncbi:hypothetical protein FSP39_020210 [Pinctada imbricata]|uniref:Uncharacterized protein n=1 Tax=Pinctada imbricata TaxID=66713 RepID=A0AA88YEQ6_PINIB|nr:hypothetical protein FSP39_020210 [Pinctada imbricata]
MKDATLMNPIVNSIKKVVCFRMKTQENISARFQIKIQIVQPDRHVIFRLHVLLITRSAARVSTSSLEANNPCDGIPCQNLGTCTQTLTGYRCNCFLGFDEQNNCEIGTVKYLTYLLPVNETDFRIAALSYSTQTTVEFFFDEHMTNESVCAAIDAIQPKSGATLTTKALERAEEMLKDNSTGSRHLKAYQYIIVVSDGLSTDRHVAISKAVSIASRGINVYVLGVDRESDHTEFVQLASETSVGTKGVFSTLNDDLLHTLYLETINHDCKEACMENSTSDIMLVLDLSRISQSVADIQLTLQSVIELVTTLDTRNNNISLGLISFGNTSSIEVPIRGIPDADKFISASQALKLKNEESNIISALNHLTLSDAFSAPNGARVDSRKLAIIFSTGNWTNIPEVTKRMIEIEATGISFIFVAIGEDANFDILTEISRDDHNIYWVRSRDHNSIFSALKSKAVFVSCKQNFF